jgi:hypothetical protein
MSGICALVARSIVPNEWIEAKEASGSLNEYTREHISDL